MSGAHHSPNKLSKIPVIQGDLYPILQTKTPSNDASSASSKLPTIIITAHIDNFGLLNVRMNFQQKTKDFLKNRFFFWFLLLVLHAEPIKQC